jgi:hypothetical protein
MALYKIWVTSSLPIVLPQRVQDVLGASGVAHRRRKDAACIILEHAIWGVLDARELRSTSAQKELFDWLDEVRKDCLKNPGYICSKDSSDFTFHIQRD